MKNRIIILLVIFSITSACKEYTTPEKGLTPEEVEIIEEDLEDAPILLGEQKRDTLESRPYNQWFMQSYKDHALDKELIAKLGEYLNDVEITVFMGTWCEDSQREVPAFYKILDEGDYDSGAVRLITVSEEKTTPEGLEEGREITNVPTFIFMKEGEELGRIVEYPLESLEKDMVKILTGEEYKHAYEE